MTVSKPKQAALYARISFDRAGESLGVQRQEEECRAWAERNGWTIAKVYRDNDLSASKRNVQRPEYEEMLADVRAGKRDGILCWDTNRLTRQLRQLAELIDLSQETGAPIGTVSGELDLTTVPGRAVAGILGVMARSQVELMSSRVSAQLRQKATSGKPTTRRRPFGWTDNTCQTLHPVEAPALQKAASDFLAGVTVRGICVRWNREGLPTTTGGLWTHITVRQLLLRWSNVAVPQYRGEPLMDTPGDWAPILDRPTFDAVRAKILTPRPAERAVRKYLLSGVLECGKCGKTLRGASGRYKCSGEVQGVCSVSILPKQADAAVTHYVLHRLKWLSGSDLLGPQQSARQAEIEVALSNLAKERQQIAESGLDLSSRIALLKSLEASESALQAESVQMVTGNALGALMASLAPIVATSEGKQIASIEQAAENMTAIRERWESLHPDQRRLIAKSLGRYVVYPYAERAHRIEIEDRHPNLTAILG